MHVHETTYFRENLPRMNVRETAAFRENLPRLHVHETADLVKLSIPIVLPLSLLNPSRLKSDKAFAALLRYGPWQLEKIPATLLPPPEYHNDAHPLPIQVSVRQAGV